DDTYSPFANRANNETDEQTKLFGGGQDEFGWGSRLDPRRGGQTDAKWNLAAGDYELIMYGRSQDCRVDKMIFHLDSIEFRQNQEGVDWVDDPETLLPPQPGGEGGNTGSAGGGLPTPSGAGGSANNGSGNGNSAGANAAAPSGGDPASTANAGTEDNGGCAVTRGGRGPSLRGWAALGLLGFLLGRRRSSP
ncbi:MAG: MYXO-CTERM sorting domain-containing protein, partial [Myxococcota bacterium]